MKKRHFPLKVTIILVLFASLFLISCDEEMYTVVKGQVSNSQTGEPIQGFILNLTEMESEIGAWSYTLEKIETDSQGRFYFGFEAKDHKIYSIQSMDNVGFTEINSAEVIIKIGKTNEYLFEVEPIE